MIVNWSRLSAFNECREKQFNWDELRYGAPRTDDNLLKGSGFHEGVAAYFAERDVRKAKEVCEAKMRDEIKDEVILEEEKPGIEHSIAWSKLAVAKFAENYEQQPVQVLWPEVKFQVPIPHSWHHCFFVHRLLAEHTCYDWYVTNTGQFLHRVCGYTTDSSVGKCASCGEPFPVCFQPHYFKGKTDAVVTWENMIWLFEHKTNSLVQEMFVQKYFLNAQPTGYMYGLWKSMGVLPHGFILNIIQKPNKRAKDQMTVGFAREPFLRSEEDLQVFEDEFRAQATEYERAFEAKITGSNPFLIYRNTNSCTSWGRKCTYFDLCQRHPREPLEGEFSIREDDYVNKAYYELIEKLKEEKHG